MRNTTRTSFWRYIPLLALTLFLSPTETVEAQWTGGGYGWVDDTTNGFCREECFLYYTMCECYRVPDMIVEG